MKFGMRKSESWDEFWISGRLKGPLWDGMRDPKATWKEERTYETASNSGCRKNVLNRASWSSMFDRSLPWATVSGQELASSGLLYDIGCRGVDGLTDVELRL